MSDKLEIEIEEQDPADADADLSTSISMMMEEPGTSQQQEVLEERPTFQVGEEATVEDKLLVEAEANAKALLEKQKELEAIKADAKKLAELRQKAIKNAVEFNAELQAVRRTERTFYWDQNTNIIHSPLNKWMRLSGEHTKPSKYPVFCLPGQYTTNYTKFEPAQLRQMPLNTVVAGQRELFLFPPKREHSPPALTVRDDELAVVVASKADGNKGKEGGDHNELSSPPTPSLAHAFGSNERETIKRIKREFKAEAADSNEPKEARAGGPPPPKLRKMSTTSSTAGNNKKTKTSTACPRLPPMSSSSSKVPASPRTTTTIPPSPKQHQQPAPSAAICSICQLSEASPNAKAQLVHCSACQQQMHSSCIDMPLSMVQVIRRYDWLCIDCKRCCVCEQPDQEAAMMCCDQCDRGYHTFCIGLDQPPNGTWHCPECKGNDPMFKQNGGTHQGKKYLKMEEEEGAANPNKRYLLIDGDGQQQQAKQRKKRGRPPKSARAIGPDGLGK